MKSMKVDVAVPDPDICSNCNNFAMDYTTIYANGEHKKVNYRCENAEICDDLMWKLRAWKPDPRDIDKFPDDLSIKWPEPRMQKGE